MENEIALNLKEVQMRKGLVCKLLAAAMMVTTVAGYGGISTSASETGERPFEGFIGYFEGKVKKKGLLEKWYIER